MRDDDITADLLWFWLFVAAMVSLYGGLAAWLETRDWLFTSPLPWLYILATPVHLLSSVLLWYLPNRMVRRAWTVEDREGFTAAVTALLAEHGYRRAAAVKADRVDFEARGFLRWKVVARCTFGAGTAIVQAPRLVQAYLRAHLPAALRAGDKASPGGGPMLRGIVQTLASTAAGLWVCAYLGAVNRWVPVPWMIGAAAAGTVLLVALYRWVLPRVRLAGAAGYAAWLACSVLPAVVFACLWGVWAYAEPDTADVWSAAQPPLVVQLDGAEGARLEIAEVRYRATDGGDGEYIGVVRNTGSVPIEFARVLVFDPRFTADDLSNYVRGGGGGHGVLMPGAQHPLELMLDPALQPGEPLWNPDAVEVRAWPITSTEEMARLEDKANWPLELVEGSVRLTPRFGSRGYRLSAQVRNAGTATLNPILDIWVEVMLFGADGQLACTAILFASSGVEAFAGDLPLPAPEALAGAGVAPGEVVLVKGSAPVCAGPVERYEIVLQRRPLSLATAQ